MALSFKSKVPPFAPEHMEAIAKVLADTSEGLTGAEIGHALAQSRIPDVDPSNTKWKRLYNAFVDFQNQHQVGNHVVVFVARTLDPARYTSNPRSFDSRRDALNPILALCGMTLGEDAKVRKVSKARTPARQQGYRN